MASVSLCGFGECASRARWAWPWLAAWVWGLPLGAAAQPVAVDDSGSFVESLHRPMLKRGGHGALLVVNQARVRLVLNTTPWLGKQVRIYARATAPAEFSGLLRWQTTGLTLAGTLSTGDRRLVYAGLVSTPQIRDILDASLEVDARLVAGPAQLSCSYELELVS